MKKLLLTIIILGACLVGSSQNWDSVRVGNLDVDSIMLGGAKIWEKQNVDTTSWTYEGVMTVGTLSDPNTSRGYVDNVYGSMLPTMSVLGSNYEQLWWYANDNLLGIDVGYYNGDYKEYLLDVYNDVIVSIDGIEYTLTYSEGTEYHSFYTESIPFPPVGETCEIKLRYTLAP